MRIKFYMKSLFIFRNDLRIFDNTALIEASKNSEKVNLIFIFNKKQIDKNLNDYYNEKIVNLMINCLENLKDEIEKNKNGNLNFFYGENEIIVEEILNKNRDIKKVFVNKDYTTFSIERDFKIKNICEKYNCEFFSFDDRVLNEPKKVLKNDGKPYTIFTPYYNRAKLIDIKKPNNFKIENFSNQKIENEFSTNLIEIKKKLNIENNKILNLRKIGLEILKNIINFKNYKVNRDFPYLNQTTQLSKFNKFGILSIREIYYLISSNLDFEFCEPLIRQLYWRDFFIQIGFNFSKVMKGVNFNENYNKVKWIEDESNENFLKWKKGETGFPIVDAGIRELNETGYMHNRVRMIVASFLTKDLHIHWKLGEKYFAKKLIDYEPLVNNGSWQWASSTGCDAQPYFRIFNPKLQQEKFDKDCIYIKKWIKELKDKNVFEIHNYETIDLSPYPKPIVNHFKEKEETLKRFKVLKE